MTILDKINYTNYINGIWHRQEKHITVLNPYDNQVIGLVPDCNDYQVREAIEGASLAFKWWRETAAEARADILLKWYHLIISNLDELANILTLEQGKALIDAKNEIIYGANFIKWSAEYANKVLGTSGNGIKPNQKIFIEYEPIGVVGAITPWNFPSAMIARKIAPALAVGCSVVVKPSELTPFSALALAYLAEQAELPKGVLNIITADAEMVGDLMTSHHKIKKISFTGSTRVGKILYQKSAARLHKLSLELGGNAPFIVCNDCDIERTAIDLVTAKIRSSGQACTSPNRIFIQEDIYDLFIAKLESELKKIRAGNGFEPGVEVGPLINQAAAHKILRLLNDAGTKGAKILLGGKILTSTILQPTLVTDCSDDMTIFSEEIFGPVLACYKFKTIPEVIERANNTDYGLASYIYTANLHQAFQIKDQLDFSMVAINEPVISQYKGAFGGRKNSGFGIEGSHLGLYEFMISKYTLFGY